MSEPMVATGRIEDRPCNLCGTVVSHKEYRGIYGTGAHWSKVGEKHLAPCGAPCFGGGARVGDSLEVYKAGQMHGLRTPCPNCGQIRNPPLEEVPDVS